MTDLIGYCGGGAIVGGKKEELVGEEGESSDL